jgi:hypothetical protein
MIPVGLQRRDLQHCRVRQGAGAVCPEAELGAVESGRAQLAGLKSRHRGARPRWNLKYDLVFGAKTMDPVSSIPAFGILAWKQNPLKTEMHAAV